MTDRKGASARTAEPAGHRSPTTLDHPKRISVRCFGCRGTSSPSTPLAALRTSSRSCVSQRVLSLVLLRHVRSRPIASCAVVGRALRSRRARPCCAIPCHDHNRFAQATGSAMPLKRSGINPPADRPRPIDPNHRFTHDSHRSVPPLGAQPPAPPPCASSRGWRASSKPRKGTHTSRNPRLHGLPAAKPALARLRADHSPDRGGPPHDHAPLKTKDKP